MGWPYFFLITKINIRENEELLLSYGQGYWGAIRNTYRDYKQINDTLRPIVDLRGSIHRQSGHIEESLERLNHDLDLIHKKRHPDATPTEVMVAVLRLVKEFARIAGLAHVERLFDSGDIGKMIEAMADDPMFTGWLNMMQYLLAQCPKADDETLPNGNPLSSGSNKRAAESQLSKVKDRILSNGNPSSGGSNNGVAKTQLPKADDGNGNDLSGGTGNRVARKDTFQPQNPDDSESRSGDPLLSVSSEETSVRGYKMKIRDGVVGAALRDTEKRLGLGAMTLMEGIKRVIPEGVVNTEVENGRAGRVEKKGTVTGVESVAEKALKREGQMGMSLSVKPPSRLVRKRRSESQSSVEEEIVTIIDDDEVREETFVKKRRVHRHVPDGYHSRSSIGSDVMAGVDDDVVDLTQE
ncbi:hypothetical protein BC829DRAFT_223449 [Chytridium lagenaria]|nr:hypothetical protein BC829DRAFT_223449 [Chytridium lagenaria]